MHEVFQAQVEGTTFQIKILKARLDGAGVTKFKEELTTAWQEGISSAEVDMAVVEFIDSSGVGALLSVYRRLPEGSASVRLINLRPQVQAVVELLRLHRIFQIVS